MDPNLAVLLPVRQVVAAHLLVDGDVHVDGDVGGRFAVPVNNRRVIVGQVGWVGV